MNYPLFIARRLSLSSGGRRNAPAVTVAVAAVALSVSVMLLSIAIVLGFKHEIKEKVIGFNSHITLTVSPTTPDESNVMTLTPSLESELGRLPFVKDYALQAAIPAILKTKDDFKGVYLKSLNGETARRFIENNLEEGELVDFNDDKNRNKVIISSIAARQLGLKTGDKIDTYFISDDVRVRRLEITGIYDSHFDQYDDVMVFGSLPLVRQLGGLDDKQGTSLQINTDNFENVPDYTISLQHHLNSALADGRLFRLYRTDNAYNQGVVYFSWLNLLDTNVVVVLILMMVVGCVTLVSGMLIIIIEKKRFIGIMKAMGAPTGKIREVFVWLALKIAISGMLIGNVLALSFMYVQSATHFIPLDPDSYYIDFVPVEISWEGIALLNAGVVGVMYLVLILPSRFVAGISPAETIKGE